MKRLLAAWLAILSLAGAGVAYAEDPNTVQPACADITGGGFTLENGVVSGSLDLADTSCTNIKYTLNVIYTNAGGRQLTRSQSVKGDATSPIVFFSLRVPPSVTTVDTYVESTNSAGTVLDRGPDSGTIPVSSGSGGGTGYN